jgi:outer membrane protein OmpA-like peptidoglycan-associated protein
MKRIVIIIFFIIFLSYNPLNGQQVLYPKRVCEKQFNVIENNQTNFFCDICSNKYNLQVVKITKDGPKSIKTDDSIDSCDISSFFLKDNEEALYCSRGSHFTLHFQISKMQKNEFLNYLSIITCNNLEIHKEIKVSCKSDNRDYIELQSDNDKVNRYYLNQIEFYDNLFVKIKINPDIKEEYLKIKNININTLILSDNISISKTDSLDQFLQKGISFKITLPDILFNHNIYNLTNIAKKQINDVVGLLIKYPNVKLQVRGYTDNIGSREYNLELSEKRAKEVYDLMLSAGLKQERLKYHGLGEAYPLFPNTTTTNRKKNRRVEIWVLN